MAVAKPHSSDARARILDAAVEQLRRHGPAKTGVVDVARALDLSHAAVYRHFASKEALFDAVAERWLDEVSRPLKDIAARRGKAARRLDEWLTTLMAIKRRKVTEDREMFETYRAVAEASHQVVLAHIDHLNGQLRRIIADGIASGEFAVTDPDAAAATVFDATTRFHHPHFVREHPADPAAERRVIGLVLAGLAAGNF